MANFSIIPKDVFERGIIRMTKGGIITMPNKDVWMTMDEIADVLFVSSATVFRTIRTIYNKGIAHEEDTHGSFRLFPYHPDWNIDVYNLEIVIRLAYTIESRNSQKFFDERSGKADYRQFIMNRLMGRPMYENVCVFLPIWRSGGAGRRRVPIDRKAGWLIETSGKWNLERNHFTTANGYIYNVMNPHGRHLSEAGIREIAGWMEQMENAIFSEGFTDTIRGYRAYIDEKSLVDWYVASEITGNMDALLSIYMYRNEGEKMKFGPLWDMDFSYGRSGEFDLLRSMEAQIKRIINS